MTADDREDPPASPWRAVVGLLLIVGLIVAVLFIMRQLQHAAAIQDCVASGRTNCAPISTQGR
jgi:F0F1-type ATP synthase assembly protein I